MQDDYAQTREITRKVRDQPRMRKRTRKAKQGHRPPDGEGIELALLAADVGNALRSMLAYRNHPDEGPIVHLAFPVVGLVAEESCGYFSAHNRTQRLGNIDGAVFDEFRHSLTKTRARIKLFDDSDKGPEELVAFMGLVRKQSKILFSHPSSRLAQALSWWFRFDLGAGFVGDHLVSTTHATLPAIGFTPEVLASLKPGHFQNISQFNYDFAVRIGAHFRRLANVLVVNGQSVNSKPGPESCDVSFSTRDFVSRRFYGHVERALPDAQRNCVPALTLCLAQVNAALHVLPHLLGVDSNLLLRAQYLTAYHSSRALGFALRTRPSWLDADSSVLASPVLRNVLAHYELRKALRFAAGSSEPLRAVVAGITGTGTERVFQIVQDRLARISELLGRSMTRTALDPVRSRLVERLRIAHG